MKNLFLFVFLLGSINYLYAQEVAIKQSELNATCSVLYKLSNKAIRTNRKELLAIYYNAYKAIRLSNVITEDCDRYFKDVKNKHYEGIGIFALGFDFPPKEVDLSHREFSNREIETLQKIKDLGFTLEDIDQLTLTKELIENNVNLKLLKVTDSEKIKKLTKNLNKLNIKDLDYNKLNSLSNSKVKLEKFKELIEN